MQSETRTQSVEPEAEAPLSRADQVTLIAACVGLTSDDVATVPGEQGAWLTPTDLEHARASLQDRGLLRADPGNPRPGAILTARGRQALLGVLSQVAAVASVQDERDQVERLRTDLLSTISHELRTPLTLIRTSIGLLLDSEPDEEMRLRLLRNIKQSTDRMNALITDMLDLARLQQDRLELTMRRIDVHELIDGAVSLMRPLLDARDQRVELVALPTSPAILGDPRRLERVLLNLLRNANTFAPAGSVIRVIVRDDEQEVVVGVQDTGPGIAAAAIPHLFDQFFTDRASASEHNLGAGLGLPIAKGIVEAHAGRIWVESTAGAGTTVWFALPRDPARGDSA